MFFFLVIIWVSKESSHIQHNGFINVDEKYLGTFLSKKWGYTKGIIEMIFWSYFVPNIRCAKTVRFTLLVFSSARFLSDLSWLNVFSDLIGFYTLSSKLFLYESYILFQSPVQAVLSIEKSCLVAHAFEHILWQCWILFWKSEKRNHQMQRALFYVKNTDKFTSPKHNLLVFHLKTNTTLD